MALSENGQHLKTCDGWLRPVENALNMAAALSIFALMLLGVTQIVLRKFFNAPIFGYIDLVELSMATFAFLGAAYCQRLGDHIRMEFLVGMLKGRSLWIAEIVGTLLGLGIISVLIWFSWEHFLRSYQLGDTTIDAEYPVWPSKLLVPLAFAVWWLRLALQLAGFLRLAVHPTAEPVAVPLMMDAAAHAQEEIREALGDDYSHENDDDANKAASG